MKLKIKNRLNNTTKRQERDTERISQTHRKASFLAFCKSIKNTEEVQNNKK